MSQNRQPRGIPTGGQYAHTAKNESGITLGATPADERPYADLTPVEVDTELARVYAEHGREMGRYVLEMQHVRESTARALGRGYRGGANREEVETRINDLRARHQAYKDGTGKILGYNEESSLRAYDRAQSHLENARALEDQMRGYDDEFEARGGWTRAFLVSNTNGHVHSSMRCSTCFTPGWDNSGNYREGTRYHWVTDLSGATEDEVVEAAGERACTVCYPSAPVETLNKPTTLFTPEEVEAQKARDERAQAKIEREAKRIAAGLTEDGSPLEVPTRWRGESFKTERAATIWAVDELYSANSYWAERGFDPQDREGVRVVVAAIAKKHDRTEADVLDELLDKARKKAKREKSDWVGGHETLDD